MFSNGPVVGAGVNPRSDAWSGAEDDAAGTQRVSLSSITQRGLSLEQIVRTISIHITHEHSSKLTGEMFVETRRRRIRLWEEGDLLYPLGMAYPRAL